MNILPNCELIDSECGASDEKQYVRSFLDKMAQAAKSQDGDTAAQRILSDAYTAVGFGPMIAALQSHVA